MVDAQRLIAASQENNVLRPRRGRQPRWTASVSSVSSSGGVPPVARPAPKGEKTLAEVSRELDIQPTVIRQWKRRVETGATTAVAADEDVVPASLLRAAQARIKELERSLGRKQMEVEILQATPPRTAMY